MNEIYKDKLRILRQRVPIGLRDGLILLETAKDFQNYINASNELREHEEYQKCEEDFKRQRPLLLERLYEFVESNSAHYP